ncbi:MAG: type II toxin-antitoxin system RatA family toxin [Gammaproteobacteria bacterium]|nr:type II toxin-antitoxin system RatA family toxin [Gammaproteobacteria bacterium]
MPKVDRSALVPYAAGDMYALVNDIASYPSFLPWCKDAKVTDINDTCMEASLEVAKGGVDQWFTTRNQLTPGKSIEMELLDGPFKHLSGIWAFETVRDNTCKVSLHIEFEFSNIMMSLVFGTIFHQICNSMLDAFVARAKEVYD